VGGIFWEKFNKVSEKENALDISFSKSFLEIKKRFPSPKVFWFLRNDKSFLEIKK